MSEDVEDLKRQKHEIEEKADGKVCADFWDYLLSVEILGCADDEPTAPLHTAEVRERCIKDFLAARRERRETFWRRA